MSNSITTLQTNTLILRPLEPADAVVLYHIYQSESVLRYLPVTVPPPLENGRRFIADQQAHWEKHGYGNWGVLPDGEHEIGGTHYVKTLSL